MTVEEKLHAMELLWEDLCSRVGGMPSPDWHGDVLAAREVSHERGQDEFEDWEQAKRNIKNRI